jgi:hypothetical protein
VRVASFGRPNWLGQPSPITLWGPAVPRSAGAWTRTSVVSPPAGASNSARVSPAGASLDPLLCRAALVVKSATARLGNCRFVTMKPTRRNARRHRARLSRRPASAAFNSLPVVPDEQLAAGPTRRPKEEIGNLPLQILVGRDTDRVRDARDVRLLPLNLRQEQLVRTPIPPLGRSVQAKRRIDREAAASLRSSSPPKGLYTD